MRGRTKDHFLKAGDRCVIKITPSPNRVYTGTGISPTQLKGQWLAKVTQVDGNGKIRAVFADSRLRKSRNPRVHGLHGEEPAFRYDVVAHTHLQGFSTEAGLREGMDCMIDIEDFFRDPRLAHHPRRKLSSTNIGVPREMIGTWNARIIAFSPFIVDGKLAVRVAVRLTDPKIKRHHLASVRAWFDREPDVIYIVRTTQLRGMQADRIEAFLKDLTNHVLTPEHERPASSQTHARDPYQDLVREVFGDHPFGRKLSST